MKTGPIVPGRLERDADGLPRSPEFGDLYHPRQGALAQARQVFLAGNALPARWRGREQFVVLETGFGLGNNFLATWQAWRDDPERSDRLHFISIEARPLPRDDLAAEPRDEPLAPLAAQLAAAWPPLTCNLHRLSFEAGRVQLLLAFGDVGDWLPQLVASVDAFFLDGFAPARNPRMWEPRLFKAMARIAAPDATAATWSVARPVRDGLAAAGFEVRSEPGSGGKREITVARFAPRFTPRPSPRQRLAIEAASASEANGCRSPSSAAGSPAAPSRCALAQRGRASILFERRPELAQEGSGNAAGVFHGVVHGHDGHHARFHRAAAYEARAGGRRSHRRRTAFAAARRGCCAWRAAAPTSRSLQALLDRLGLPADYVRAVSAREAGVDRRRRRRRPGLAFRRRRLGRAARPGARLRRPRRRAAGRPLRPRGRRPSPQARPLAAPRRRRAACSRRAEVVVLANAGAALDLLGGSALPLQSASRPDQRRRHRALAGGRGAAPAARRLGLPAAAARRHDLVRRDLGRRRRRSRRLRSDDHRANVERLAGLVAEPPSLDALGELSGRVGWRWASPDRLPLIGPVPLAAIGAELGVELGAEGLAAARAAAVRAAGAGTVRLRWIGIARHRRLGARRAGARRVHHR